MGLVILRALSETVAENARIFLLSHHSRRFWMYDVECFVMPRIPVIRGKLLRIIEVYRKANDRTGKCEVISCRSGSRIIKQISRCKCSILETNEAKAWPEGEAQSITPFLVGRRAM